MSSGKWFIVIAVTGLLLAGAVVGTDLGSIDQGAYDRTTVTAVDSGTGTELAAIDVRIADTQDKRYTGLSDTESLGADEGMLFIHGSEGEYSYVMREMAFPIDIVFIDASGEITQIHNAPVDAQSRFSGTGKYVLEVPYEYMADNNIDVGDRIEIPEQYR